MSTRLSLTDSLIRDGGHVVARHEQWRVAFPAGKCQIDQHYPFPCVCKLYFISRLPSSLSQFEQAIGHWRGRRSGDGQSLVDCFQNEAAVETPGEGAEVAREMFGRDGAVRGQEAVL